jgi:hypothetical protein
MDMIFTQGFWVLFCHLYLNLSMWGDPIIAYISNQISWKAFEFKSDNTDKHCDVLM